MPGMDGLALAQRLRALNPPPGVVFVTAHAEHALQAFEIDAVDYLTKPVRRSRLQEALARIVARLGRAVPVAPAAEPVLDQPTLVVSDRGRVLRVPFDEVVYLKAEMKYVTLRTVRHSHVLDDALSDLEQRLGDSVVRIHRNALVAKAAVRALERRAPSAEDPEDSAEGWAVRLAPHDEWLSVSRRQLAAVRDALTAEGF
jgi:two-component system response regulator AlgR